MVFTLLAMVLAGKFCIVLCKACSLGPASSLYIVASTLSYLTLRYGGGTHFCNAALQRLTCRVVVTGPCGPVFKRFLFSTVMSLMICSAVLSIKRSIQEMLVLFK